MTDCYNCEGQGKVSIPGIPICPDCGCSLMFGKSCGCGSTDDLLQQFSIIECPICKGSGETPPKQLAFPELKTSFIRRK